MRKTQCRELHPQRLFPAQTAPFSSSAPPTISAVSSQIWGTVLIWMANGVEGRGEAAEKLGPPCPSDSCRNTCTLCALGGPPPIHILLPRGRWGRSTCLSLPPGPKTWGPPRQDQQGQAPDHLQVSGSYLCREDRTGTGGTFWCKNPGGIKETRSDQLND